MTKKIKFNGKPYKTFSYNEKKLLAILGIAIGASITTYRDTFEKKYIKEKGNVEYSVIGGKKYHSDNINLLVVEAEVEQEAIEIIVTPETVINKQMIAKAYRTTQTLLHPDKIGYKNQPQSLTKIQRELEQIKELIMQEDCHTYRQAQHSLSIPITELVMVLDFVYSAKYDVSFSSGEYLFKAKETTTSKNNTRHC